ncbi:MAG TPA: glycoside hydrolase family 78 protein [Bacteroidales bacterium]|nr:glycoside hydrolase family 78 protein [Bacteroidales bacterium]
MKPLFTLILLLMNVLPLLAQDLAIVSTTTEHRRNPVGIGTTEPRFSWVINATGRNIIQSAYYIEVATDNKFAKQSMVWQSGQVSSDRSVLVQYAGQPLRSSQRYFWHVKVMDNKKRESKWSEAAYFETGLLSKDEWKAAWIELPGDTLRYSPSPSFRKEFQISKPVASARIYVTSHGYYELHLNGSKVGDQVLTPGWTSYGKRLQYQEYDVTGMLNRGSNAVGAVLGDGWYRGTLAWGNNWAIYGKHLGLLLRMKITFTDGSEMTVLTDESWKGNLDGAIRMNDIYNGESFDATKDLAGWDKPGYDDSKWIRVTTGKYDNSNLICSESVPVRKIQEIKPVKIFRTPKGSLIADMGQNMVGWIRLRVKGEKGRTVILRHAEVLDKYGEFYTGNLRSAKCTITYTMNGNGEEVYEPRFTFMGFRFVEVTGFPGELKPENLTGIVVHSDMTPTGTFECSNPLVNQLQHNIVWGMKGNYVDVPTDCPQRDERLGWTGDAQAFCRTAAFNMDVSPFFAKWLRDVAADQRPGGEVPVVIPDVLDRQGSETASCSAGWGDVSVIAPWTMYTVYGDRKFLENQYPSMKAWVEYIMKKAGDSFIWKGGSLYGDWLFYHPPVNNHPEPDGYTQPDYIATAYYAYSTKILAHAAGELGKKEDEKRYNELFNNIKKAFIHEYVTPAGRVGTCSQTSYVLALMFGLLPDDLNSDAVSFLVEDIKNRGNRLSTGFLGSIYLCHVLSAYGRTDVAYELLLQEHYPSWLYPVKMGATTIWERWDGQKTDSTFQDPGMNSFNHYAYGAVGDWMYRVVAGIETETPGYRHLRIQPSPGEKLSFARASFESPYGTISSGWIRNGDGKTEYSVRIPANTDATIVLPAGDLAEVTEGGKPVGTGTGFSNISVNDGRVNLKAGSGEYHFIVNRKK